MLYSTHQVAKKLGISVPSLYRYIEQKKIPAPEAVRIGDRDVRSWTEDDIENVRKMLPKIANGRKTRYKKKQSAVSTHGKPGRAQQSAKTKGAQARRLRSKKKK